jgi:large subunit ribosomal protein L23
MKDAYSVILAPLVTEKMAAQAEKANVVAFKVARGSNKLEVKRAIESIWKVKVESVRTQTYLGKPKRLGRFFGRRKTWKKAIVTLAEGQSIPDFS